MVGTIIEIKISSIKDSPLSLWERARVRAVGR
jgi:hypothetical protein